MPNLSPPTLNIMKGGAKAAVLDIISKQWSPIEIYIMMFLILSIVFVREYPKEVRLYADTILGKTVLFGAAVAVSMKYSWINGIFIAIFTLLMLSMSPRRNEGFQAAGAKVKTNMKIVDDKNPWWVEAVLKERTSAIEEDDVSTSAVQDGDSVSRSNSDKSSP